MGRGARAAAWGAVLVVWAGAVAVVDPAAADGGAERWAARGAVAGESTTSFDVAVSSEGSTVVVTGETRYDKKQRFATIAYDSATGAHRWVAEFPEGTDRRERGTGLAVAVAPDDTAVFVTGQSTCASRDCTGVVEGATVIAYDLVTGARTWVWRLAGIGTFGRALGVSPDGSTLFAHIMTSAGHQNLVTIVALDTATGAERWRSVVESANVYDSEPTIAVSADGSTLYVADSDPDDGPCPVLGGGYRTRALDAVDGTVVWEAFHSVTDGRHCGGATDLALSPDGRTVYVTGVGGPDADHSGHGAGTVAYDAATGAEVWSRQDEDVSVLNGSGVELAVDPDSSQVYVGGGRCGAVPYCRSSTATVLALAADDGRRMWRSGYDPGGRIHVTDLAADESGVYLAAAGSLDCASRCREWPHTGELVAFDDGSGDLSWVSTTPDSGWFGLALAPDASSLYLAGTTYRAHRLTGLGRSSRAAQRCRCALATVRVNSRPGPGIVQETAAGVRLDGWQGRYHSTASGGRYRTSAVRGARAEFVTPSTRRFEWLTRVGPHQGRARVLLDGRHVRTVDLYAPRPGSRVVRFRFPRSARHRLVVEVTGTRRAASRGAWVAVDGFRTARYRGVVQDTSPAVRFGSWAGAAALGSGQVTLRVSGERGATISHVFTGRAVRWLTRLGPAFGLARVTVDGRSRVVDLYRPRSRDGALAFTRLGPGRHRVTVEPLGRRHRASRSTDVAVDAFVVR